MEIKYFDRKSNTIEVEAVYGEPFVRWLYTTNCGKKLQFILVRRFLSKIYGFTQSLPPSAKKIPNFIRQFSIKMEQFEVTEYHNFNQFFIRRFRPKMRPFISEENQMPAGCEARYLGFSSVDETVTFPIKGGLANIKTLLNSEKWGQHFNEGPLLIARLAPVDYHRFHFFDDCTIMDHYHVAGPLHSVNPVALKENPSILVQNARHVTILQTNNFGTVAMIEVGALCVGAIEQTYEGNQFKRGQEKGHFLFGGSTVAFLGTKDAWEPTADILDHSARGMETLVQLGDWVATAK